MSIQHIFDDNGHLTDFALRSLVSEQLEEMQRYEATEHLSFCDECLSCYVNRLSDDSLIEVTPQLEETILHKVKTRVRKIIFNRYFAASAAAVLAITFWVCGIFDVDHNLSKDGFISKINQATHNITQSAEDFQKEAKDKINRFLSQFDFKGVFSHEKK